jgi:hypothetical protein
MTNASNSSLPRTGARSVPTLLLSGLACLASAACTPARPVGVPETAEFNPKGSVAWNVCTNTESLEQLDLYECTRFNGNGRELSTAWYVELPEPPAPQLTPEQQDALDYVMNLRWWKKRELLSVFEIQTYSRGRFPDRAPFAYRLRFMDKDCLALLGAGDYATLTSGLPDLQFATGQDRVHPRFVAELSLLPADLKDPVRAERASACYVEQYFQRD